MALTKAKASNILLTTPAASSNDTTPATTQYVTTAIANLIDNAPANLNTLNELAAAMADNASFFSTVLPLSGGTMTGALTGTTASFSTASTSDSVLTLTDTGVAAYEVTFPDTGTYQLSTNTTSDKTFKLLNSGSGTFNLNVEGNVGIGVTPSQYKLQVNGGIQLSAKSLIDSNAYFISGTNGFRWNNSTDAHNNVIMYDNGNMYVRANVGIGTTTINADLHLGAASPHIDLGPPGGNRGKVGFDSNNVYIGSSSGTGQIHFKNNIGSTDAPHSSGDTKMVIGDSGVGIGTTTLNKVFNMIDPAQGAEEIKLHFEASSGADKWAIYSYDRVNNHYTNLSFGANYLYLKSGGNVGIGTTGALAKLHVSGDELFLQGGNTTTGPGIFMGDSNFANASYYNSAPGIGAVGPYGAVAGGLAFYNYGGASNARSEAMRIAGPGSTAGFVGIGTQAPKRMLQVGNNTQAIAALSLQATTTGKSRIYMGDNDATSGEYEGLISYDHNVNNLEVWSGGGNRMTILGTSQSNSHVDIHGGVSVGIGNTTAAGDTGINVKGWYNATAHSTNTYLHLNTSLWGGGSPYGNAAYIMGGWEITGHQYASNASHGKCNVFFHNWNGSVGNGYSLNYTGLYTGWCHVYVNSSGYVTVRLLAGTYRAYWLDYYQAPHYPVRNTYVTAATFSNSATL